MASRLRIIHFALLLLIFLPLPAAVPLHTSQLRDSILKTLPQQTSPNARISTLYNIFDLSTRREDRIDVLRQLYDVADVNDNTDVQLDVLIHLANNLRDNDAALAKIENELGQFDETDRQREALLFVKMSRSDIISKNLSHGKVNKSKLDSLFRRDNFPSSRTTSYDRALMLYSLCSHLAKNTGGELLEHYVERLEKAIDSLPLPAGSVRNLIYTRAAPVFTNNQNYRKAVEIDKKMINIIDSMSDAYHRNGRPYRNFNTSRFVCYRRLLGNFKGLRPFEVDAIYTKIQDLAKEDPRIANDNDMLERTDIFYYLAKERYNEAKEAIKRQIDKPSNKEYRYYYLNSLVEAAEKTNDIKTQLEAAVELNKLLRAEIERKATERYRELEIIYDLNSMKEASDAAVTAKEERRTLIERILGAGLAVAVLVLVILLVILMRKNRKINHLATRQAKFNEKLRNERNELKRAQEELIKTRDQAKAADKHKTDFINNMSHEVKTPLAAIVEYSRLIVDCVPEDKSSYLQRFANILELNVRFITTLVNDVLDIASLEHGTLTINPRPSSLYDMCMFALDNLFEDEGHTRKGVEVVFNAAKKPDVTIETDSQRVAQVLINMLSNADKFTDRGRIDLEFDVDKEAGMVNISVTDTGIGIPSSQSEEIFSRFRKLDNTMPGSGLGLYISRLLATLLGGKLWLDTSYHGGARFVFSLPIKGQCV